MLDWWYELQPWQQSVAFLTGSLVVFIVFRVVVVRALDRFAKSTENDLDDRLVQFFRRIFGIVLLFLVLIGVLKIFDIKITPFLASAGIVGVAIGLAAKETLADLLAGFSLIADRPMRIGDRVKIENIGKHWGSWGDVVDVGLRRTMIRNTDGVVVNYPNSMLVNSVITNFSYEEKPVRVRVRFQVDYRADLERAQEIARDAIAAVPAVITDSAEIVVRSLWDDTGGHALAGVLLEGRYRIENVRKRTKVRSLVLQSILTKLRAENIPMASPRVRVESTPES